LSFYLPLLIILS